MTEAQLRAACEALCGQVYGLVKDKHAELVQEKKQADDANSKFTMAGDATEAQYGELGLFYEGAEKVVGDAMLLAMN